jgi:hypothetical protein
MKIKFCTERSAGKRDFCLQAAEFDACDAAAARIDLPQKRFPMLL